MKKILVVALAVFAMGVAGCTVGTGTDEFVDDAAVEMPEGDASTPFEIEPAGDAGDSFDDDLIVDDDADGADVEAEGSGETASDDEGEYDVVGAGEVELLTDESDIVTITETGISYTQMFQVADYGAQYEWSVEGLPAGSSLTIEKFNSSGTKAELKGIPNDADIGEHQVTVSVWDVADPSNNDTIAFNLFIMQTISIGDIDVGEDPCGKPLTIEVVEVGNYVDPDILNAGEFMYEIGSKVKVKVRARRGLLPPKGVVTWEFSSEVENSEHCHFTGENPLMGVPLPTDYNYGWIFAESCLGGNIMPRPAIESGDLEIRKTTNPFWLNKSPIAINAVRGGSANTELKLEGRLLYDGPLPVWNMPLDTDPVERLTIKAKDQCEASEGMRLTTAFKTFKFHIAYPDTVDSKGGDMGDLKAHMDYNEVNQYWNGGSGPFEVDCSGVEDQYEPVCEANSHFAVVFTGSEGLSDRAREAFEGNWDLIPALKESIGYVHYDFKRCDDVDYSPPHGPEEKNHKSCAEKRIKSGDVKSSVLDAAKVYLLWVAPTKLHEDHKHYADFNIKKITFKNRYWYAKFRDEDDDFNNNITKNFTRSDSLWHFDGMTSRAKRFSGDSKGSVIFHRRELAGYVPDFQ